MKGKTYDKVALIPLEEADREQFIIDNQEAFRYGATEEFGMRDNHFEEDGEIISRNTIEKTIDKEDSEAYRIVVDGEKAGGVVLSINNNSHRNELELLFVFNELHSKGIGFAAWQAIEALHPETEIWETATPYFEKRNIHFYVNRCGFKIVEFYNSHHADPDDTYTPENGEDEVTGMFRFEKVMDHIVR